MWKQSSSKPDCSGTIGLLSSANYLEMQGWISPDHQLKDSDFFQVLGCVDKHMSLVVYNKLMYSKTCAKRPLKNRQKKILMTNGSLMKVESIAECSKGSILQQYF